MNPVDIKEKVVFVTGANRGIGKAFAKQALEHGAKKVYASGRNLDALKDVVALDPNRVVAVELDVTQQEQVEQAAGQAKDVQILINNAGVAHMGTVLDLPDLNNAYHEMEVNYFGILRMTRAFAPALRQNEGSAVINIASVASYSSFPRFAPYSASKAAAHSITQAFRAERSRRVRTSRARAPSSAAPRASAPAATQGTP